MREKIELMDAAVENGLLVLFLALKEKQKELNIQESTLDSVLQKYGLLSEYLKYDFEE